LGLRLKGTEMKPLFVFVFFFALPSLAYGQTYHSACEDDPQIFKLDTFALTKGSLTLTEVAILAKGKDVCANGIPERRVENSDTVKLFFQDFIFACVQHGDEKRIAAARLTSTPQHVIGKFQGLENNLIMLNDCEFEDF